MALKPIIQGLAGVWLLLFVVSFIALELTVDDGSLAGGLRRLVAFLTWQGLAFGVAAVGALLTRTALVRGVSGVKLLGYVPLAVSVFLVVSFIAIIGYRVFVVPVFAVS